MARSAAAAAAPRAKPARSATARSAAARPKTARAAAPARPKARRAAPARRASGHAARTHAPRRASGPAAAHVVALPVRVFNAPFGRAARRRATGVLDALLSGRGWIGLVFVLLAGIVFFNVDLLQMNRDIARDDAKISALKREIARNRLDVARLASTERIMESAAQLGLVQPSPGEVRYLKARPRLDAHQAAKRITAPNAAYIAPEPIDTAPEPVDTTVVDPGTTDPAAATTTEPTVTDPTVADPAAVDPATTTTAAPVG
jgi:cell division protein FtsL